jgi:hypothetical protein
VGFPSPLLRLVHVRPKVYQPIHASLPHPARCV